MANDRGTVLGMMNDKGTVQKIVWAPRPCRRVLFIYFTTYMLVVFKSLVQSGFFSFWGKTATATGFPILKKLKNWTGTIKDWSDPVFFSSLTSLDRFSPNRSETGPSWSRPMVLPYHTECLYIILYINIYYILHMQGSKSY